MNTPAISYQVTNPADAHPDLPVHLWRVIRGARPDRQAEYDKEGRFMRLVRVLVPYTNREWINSFATRDLALGRVPPGAKIEA